MKNETMIRMGDMIDEAKRLNRGLIEIIGMMETAMELGGEDMTEDGLNALKELAALVEQRLDAAQAVEGAA